MKKETKATCRAVFENFCKTCKLRKKNQNDCSIHKSILVPMFVYQEEPMFADDTAEKIFKGDVCKLYKE